MCHTSLCASAITYQQCRVLSRFLEGKQSHDNTVLTAITVSVNCALSFYVLTHSAGMPQALNVVIRMEPSLKYPFNVRSFFTDADQQDIGGGIVLWRGYFQSVRPAIGKMLINVDISTGTMYKPGRVIDVALEFVDRKNGDPNLLAPKRGFPERERIKLQRFLSGVRVDALIPGQAQTNHRPARVVKKLTTAGASQLSFTLRSGQTLTVAEYFEQTHNYKLRFPDIVCIEVGMITPSLYQSLIRPVGWIRRHHTYGMLYHSRGSDHAQASTAGED